MLNQSDNSQIALVAARIARATLQCMTDGQLEFVRRYAILASARYRVDLLPLLGRKG